MTPRLLQEIKIVALRNEKGSYNGGTNATKHPLIVALRNEKGSYNRHLVINF